MLISRKIGRYMYGAEILTVKCISMMFRHNAFSWCSKQDHFIRIPAYTDMLTALARRTNSQENDERSVIPVSLYSVARPRIFWFL